VSSYYLSDDLQTEKFGARLAKCLGRDGAILYLHGELGAGKTTLSRGLIRALGHSGPVKSPTYTLVEPYENFDFPLYHFDLYRLSVPEEVEFLGVEECFRPPAVNLIEWPERGHGFLPRPDLELTLAVEGDGRRIHWQPMTPLGERICSGLPD
jgi:tRNA threonylcarbamoyladenosine biosynthesis protein TsaE